MCTKINDLKDFKPTLKCNVSKNSSKNTTNLPCKNVLITYTLQNGQMHYSINQLRYKKEKPSRTL